MRVAEVEHKAKLTKKSGSQEVQGLEGSDLKNEGSEGLRSEAN